MLSYLVVSTTSLKTPFPASPTPQICWLLYFHIDLNCYYVINYYIPALTQTVGWAEVIYLYITNFPFPGQKGTKSSAEPQTIVCAVIVNHRMSHILNI